MGSRYTNDAKNIPGMCGRSNRLVQYEPAAVRLASRDPVRRGPDARAVSILYVPQPALIHVANAVAVHVFQHWLSL